MDLTEEPRLEFAVAPEWLVLRPAELSADLRGWAARAADRFMARSQAFSELRPREPLIDYFTGVGRIFLDDPSSAGFAYLPDDHDFEVRCLLRLERLRAPGPDEGEGLRDLLASLQPPSELLAAEPSVSELDSPAGPLGRLSVLSVAGGAEPAAVAAELRYVWWFPDVPAAVLLTTAVLDHTQIDRCTAAADLLAQSAARTAPDGGVTPRATGFTRELT